MTEVRKLNIYEKLQQARVDLQNKNLKKTGKNKYSNYDYFELSDFLPSINFVCLTNRISTIFYFAKEEATLTIVDIDNVDSTIKFVTPIEIAALKGCSNIQNIGGTQSYARRYLYIMAFEVAESDVLDSGSVEVDTDAIEASKRIDKSKVATLRKLLDDTNADTNKFLSYYGVANVEDLTNETFFNALKMLTDKKSKQEGKKDHKKQELRQEVQAKQEDFGF